jgi:TPR repeat protein
VFLGHLYLNGKGVAKDEAKAIGLLREASELGEPGADHLLAQCYENGWGVKKDLGKAKELAYKAADNPDSHPGCSLQASKHTSSRKNKLDRLHAAVDHPEFKKLPSQDQALAKKQLDDLERDKATCANEGCGKVEPEMGDFSSCADCRGKTKTRYCSRECQLADRKTHRVACKLARMRVGAVPLDDQV